MKYTIEGFQQKELIKLNLDCTDAVILRWIVDFWNTGKMVKIINKEKEFVWIKYDSVLENLPILDIKKRAIQQRFFKYVSVGLMEKHTHKIGGTFSCFRLTEKYYPLVGQTTTVVNKNTKGSSSNDYPKQPKRLPLAVENTKGKHLKRLTKDSSIKQNNSIKDSFTKDYNSFFLPILEYWNSKDIIKSSEKTYINNISTSSNILKDYFKKIKKDFSLENIYKAIDNYTIVLKDEKYFWTYKWPICDFLKRGLNRFSDNEFILDSYINFNKKNNQETENKELKKKLRDNGKFMTDQEWTDRELKMFEKKVDNKISYIKTCLKDLEYIEFLKNYLKNNQTLNGYNELDGEEAKELLEDGLIKIKNKEFVITNDLELYKEKARQRVIKKAEIDNNKRG